MKHKAEKLSDTTLRVYKFMVMYGKPIGIRELQRRLNLSSPSLAYYHLSKLEKMGLVEKTIDSKYQVKKVVKVSVLRDYIILGNKMIIPRFAFYSMFTTVLTAAYFMTLRKSEITTAHILGLIIALFSTAVLWFETIRMIRS